MEIHPLLVDALPGDIVESVKDEYLLHDFQVENISLERISDGYPLLCF